MCRIEIREIVYEKIGDHQRAMTLEEALELREKRRQLRLAREAEEAALKAAHNAAKADRQQEQDAWDAVEYVPTGTMQCGGTMFCDSINRQNYGSAARKEEYDLSRGCGRGDKGLRAKTRAQRRHGIDFPVVETVDVLESIDPSWAD